MCKHTAFDKKVDNKGDPVVVPTGLLPLAADVPYCPETMAHRKKAGSKWPDDETQECSNREYIYTNGDKKVTTGREVGSQVIHLFT